ncbi:tetratricopeptide repeat protein [Streptomyces celluloflavus]
MHRDVNAIGGSAWINGPSIQAGAVRGGLHIYPGAAAPVLPVPRQLLPVSPHFTNRERELSALDELYARCPDTATPLIVVSGTAGIGKTALVSRWLRDAAERFPDGQLYADLRGHSPEGPAAPGEILGQFLRALGVGPVPADLGEQTALWRSVTAALRIAVMLDNVFSAAQARPLLPGGQGGLVVATSRHRLTGLRADGALYYQLGLLDRAAAVEILSRGIGQDRVESESSEADEVVSLCAGLPLAVCLASARLASRPRQPMSAMVDALAQERGRLAALAIAGESESSVYNALDESYAVLTADVRRLYRRLALLPVRTFEARIAAAVCAIPLVEAGRLLDALVEANLVEDIGADAYRFHDLVRLHAEERGRTEESAAALDETLRRVCDWYLATATEAQRLLSPRQFTLSREYRFPPDPLRPFARETDALNWLEARRNDLLAAVHAAYARQWDDLAWQLVDAMWPLFHRLRYFELWADAHETGLRAARRAGNRTAERQMLNSGAIGFNAAGRVEEAITWFTRSLDAAREAGDVRDEGQALHGLGTAHWQAGRPAEATSFLARAIDSWEAVGYPRGAALSRIVLGEMTLADGGGERPGARTGQRAEEYFARAHKALLAVDDPYDAARALALLGRARVLTGAYESGMAQLADAGAVFEAAGAAHWQARTLELLGTCAREHADLAVARGFYERSRALYERQSPSDARRVGDLLAGVKGPDVPVGPAGTAEPVESVHPLQPAGPVEQVEPSGPAGSADPAGSVDPADSADPPGDRPS